MRGRSAEGEEARWRGTKPEASRSSREAAAAMSMIRQAVAGSLALFTAAQNDDMNDDDDEQPPLLARLLLKKEELLTKTQGNAIKPILTEPWKPNKSRPAVVQMALD